MKTANITLQNKKKDKLNLSNWRGILVTSITGVISDVPLPEV